ncbi:hypothetical protein CK203_105184 [Vitis vinifera]|uniref:RPA-interacting protein C-terminal domain-containing protein n=1 Tax=Vitis vinifera TaxID=29760 RepID=A0A438CBK1_VITVI|nr:hypothetical protein CK203_105184 [Vitis vinifera]
MTRAARRYGVPSARKGSYGRTIISSIALFVSLDLKEVTRLIWTGLQVRLGEAYSEHLDRGCRFTPQFHVYTQFSLTALYIQCEACKIFETHSMTLFPDVPILKVQSEVSSLQYSSYPWNTYQFASTSILLQLPHLFIVYGRSPTDIVTSVHSYNISQNSVKGTLFA